MFACVLCVVAGQWGVLASCVVSSRVLADIVVHRLLSVTVEGFGPCGSNDQQSNMQLHVHSPTVCEAGRACSRW